MMQNNMNVIVNGLFNNSKNNYQTTLLGESNDISNNSYNSIVNGLSNKANAIKQTFITGSSNNIKIQIIQ